MVLRRLMSFKGARPQRERRLPDGRRLYAIGDVHGRLDLLDMLLARIDEDDAGRGPARSGLVFVGDLVDRGPDSAGVVARVMALAGAGRVAAVLAGNHEEIMLGAIAGEDKATRLFVRIGGRETLLSYGLSQQDYVAAELSEIPDIARRIVPEAHVAFLQGLADHHREGDYLFVHAGIRPGVPIEAQRRSDLRWIRSEFLDHRGAHEALVIHGHTITDTVDERDNRIGIDTGAYATGRLTAIGLEGAERWYLEADAADAADALAPPLRRLGVR